MRKLLYIGAFSGIWISDYYRLDGFRKHFDTMIIDFRAYDYYGFKNIFKKVMKVFDPDIIFINKGESIDVSILEEYKWQKPEMMVVIFNGDQRGRTQEYLRRFTGVDYLLINNADNQQWDDYYNYGFRNICEYHTASDTDIFKRCNTDVEYDIAFAGGYYGRRFPLSEFRRECISVLANKGFKITLAGNGNWKLRSNGNINYAGMKYGINFSRFVSSARVILGISAYDKIKNYTSNRTWNSLATGTYLCHRYDGCDSFFKDNENIVFFDNISGLVEKARMLVNDQKLRNDLYRNSRELVVNKHTYGVRAVELDNIYEDYLKKVE